MTASPQASCPFALLPGARGAGARKAQFLKLRRIVRFSLRFLHPHLHFPARFSPAGFGPQLSLCSPSRAGAPRYGGTTRTMRRAAALLMPGQRAVEAKPARSVWGDNADGLAATRPSVVEASGVAVGRCASASAKKTTETPAPKRKTPAGATDVRRGDSDVPQPLAPPTAQQPGAKRARRVSSPHEVRTVSNFFPPSLPRFFFQSRTCEF